MSDNPHLSPFEAMRRVSEAGNEYWSARDLDKLLGYGKYRFFKHAIQKAEEACENSRQTVSDHFVHTHAMIGLGKGAKRKVDDVHQVAVYAVAMIQVHPGVSD
jgi:DNA-damage-inducible protein D